MPENKNERSAGINRRRTNSATGLAIMLTTLALNMLSSWARTVADPQQRWRLEISRKALK